MIEAKKAVILASGGLDSTTVLAIAESRGFDLYALSFRYGQRHKAEIEAARKICEAFKVKQHSILDMDLRAFGGSALTDDIAVPKNRTEFESIPMTYAPARNTIFLSFALAWAEVLSAEDIFIGVNALDYSGYHDCRPEFVSAFQNLANLATQAGVEGKSRFTIHTPLMTLNKAEIIKAGIDLGVDYSLTLTCYDPNLRGESCGSCDSCLLRLKGFKENGIQDPISYQNSEK